MNKPVCKIKFLINQRDFLSTLHQLTDEPPEFVGRIREFYDLWRGIYVDGKIPNKSDFTFEILKGWHSSIRLVDLGTNVDSDKRNIILGELYKRYWGDKTMIAQILAMDENSQEALDGYRKFLSYFYQGHYGINVGYAPDPNGSIKKLIWIDLPLSSTGEKIDHLITALLPYDEK